MRPRKHETGLPRCVYERRGCFYLVKRGKWYYLGPNRDIAVSRAEDMARAIDSPSYKDELQSHIRVIASRLLTRSKTEKGKRRSVDIDADYLIGLAEDAGWCCCLTGIAFRLDRISGRRPYAPSVDRIDNSVGYVKGNCRIVCAAANFAMNVWGEAMLFELAHALIGKSSIGQSNKAAMHI